MFEIIDCHAHIFPPLGTACGFDSAATHLLHQQRAMHGHRNQPYRRLSDHAIVTDRVLWSATDHSESGRNLAANYRVGRNGRMEWDHGGESFYCQFLPPNMQDMASPAEFMAVQMDYAGIRSCVLQNDHIYGNLAIEFADAMRRFPGRFIGLAQVEEAWAWRDDQMAWLEEQITRHKMNGLYFTMAGFFRNGFTKFYDDPVYDPFWNRIAEVGWPVFWVHSASSPVGTYEDEMRIFRRYMDKHPTIRNVLVHGIPTSVFADANDKITWPQWMGEVMDRYNVWSEVLFPIMWGGKMNYPFPRAHVHLRQMYDRFGPGKLTWGSDMPNVERYCTYRQTLTYIWDYCDFLSEADRRLMFRENTLGLFGRGAAAAQAAD